MSIFTRTDVTAVKIHSNFILAGIGSFANIFEKESRTLLHRIHCLNGQKIYGFVPSNSGCEILVFGGKQFTVLSVEPAAALERRGEAFLRYCDPVVCDDWLHSAVWIDGSTVALLTAHNVVQKWNVKTQSLLSQHGSKDNSILYSGLLLPLIDDLLVFAGTVFSEIIIHRCSGKPLHHLSGHRGVIFSIACNPQKEIIVTTSDDRSVRIWGVNNKANFTHNTIDYWEQANITCLHDVYGHNARVMRSCITSNNIIVSVGEDSALCYWDFQGNLIRKITSHQNGCIWSVDGGAEHVVTGGGDCGVILHPATVATNYSYDDIMKIDVDTPKKVLFTARRNIVVLNDTGLYYYDVDSKTKFTINLDHQSTFKLLCISPCKQIIATADMCGKLDVFVENCKETAYLQHIIDTSLAVGKILSMQWASNRHLTICSENGNVTVLASRDNKTEVYAKFVLPACKERWLTASAIDSHNKILVLGDRCGNVHVYVKGQTDPIKTFCKVHGRYGPISITINNNRVITTGRDGTIRYFHIDNNDRTRYLNSKELEFLFVEKFLDKDERLICGFHERLFVVYDIKTNTKLLEVPCGGGHRSWDAVRYFNKVNEDYEEFIRFIYLKNSDIHISTFQLSKIVSKMFVNGSHSKEINCLKTYKCKSEDDLMFYISGGEDTTLRVSSLNMRLQFQDEVVMKQLSSVRALRILALENNAILLVSAGGRAQICIKKVNFEKVNDKIKLSPEVLVDYLIKGTDKERKGNQTWRNCTIDFDPETRIMDVDVIKVDDNEFVVFAGCSDALIRVFKYTLDSKTSVFKLTKELRHHKTCVLKTNCIQFIDKYIMITCCTRGEVAFWDVTDINTDLRPIFTTKTNKSGINSFASRVLSEKYLLFATGGDDNSIHLNLIEVPDKCNLESTRVSYQWSSSSLHSSQITGLILLDGLVISSSIDQRITMCRWQLDEGGLKCNFVMQTFSDVADIQGMDLLENNSEFATVCVFGKGMDVMRLAKTT